MEISEEEKNGLQIFLEHTSLENMIEFLNKNFRTIEDSMIIELDSLKEEDFCRLYIRSEIDHGCFTGFVRPNTLKLLCLTLLQVNEESTGIAQRSPEMEKYLFYLADQRELDIKYGKEVNMSIHIQKIFETLYDSVLKLGVVHE